MGLPLYETFEASYGSNGAIFGLPSWNLTMEIVEAIDAVAVDHHEQLCLYFPDKSAQQAAIARLQRRRCSRWSSTRTGRRPAPSPIATPMAAKWCSRPFVFGANEPADSSASGKHEFPSD